MGNNPKVMIGLAVLGVLGVLLIVSGNAAVGAGALVLAVAGAVFLMRSGGGSDDFLEAPERRPARTKTKVAEPEEAEEEWEPVAADDDDAAPLPSWGGGEPLAAWTPPEDEAEEEEAEEEWYEEAAVDEFGDLTFEEEEEAEAEEYEPLPTFEFEPLAEPEEEAIELDFEPLPEPEPEPEPVAEAPKAFSFGNNSLIKEIEDVHTADDIMKSSAATELALSSDKGDNSELARLLAKVQNRLAAYD